MSAPPAGELRRRLARELGPRAPLLRQAVAEARRRGADSYLVGGPVRDLLLGRPILDLDVLLSDRLGDIARSLARRSGTRLLQHERFLTATVTGAGIHLDLAQARRERYPRPGALPVAEPASVAEDLGRRDFTIHAMALPLDARSGRELLDPHGGLADLQQGVLRVLHGASFRDDPTRALRAARYAARLGFRLERGTERALRAAVRGGALGDVSGERIAHELQRLLVERDPAAAARRSDALGLLDAVARGWRLRADGARGLRRLPRVRARPPWPEAGAPPTQLCCGWRLLLLGAPRRVRREALARLGWRGRPARELEDDLARFASLVRALERRLGDGALDARLANASPALLLLLHCAGGERVARRVGRYCTVLRPRPDPLDGHAARGLGLRGPAIGRLLRDARRRALDGRPLDERWLRRRLAALREMD